VLQDVRLLHELKFAGHAEAELLQTTDVGGKRSCGHGVFSLAGREEYRAEQASAKAQTGESRLARCWTGWGLATCRADGQKRRCFGEPRICRSIDTPGKVLGSIHHRRTGEAAEMKKLPANPQSHREQLGTAGPFPPIPTVEASYSLILKSE
jgi:hypothetical protein